VSLQANLGLHHPQGWLEGMHCASGTLLGCVVLQPSGGVTAWVRRPRCSCRLCPSGEAPAILEGSTEGACAYAQCGEASALAPAPASAPTGATNTAAMAAPAIVLTLLVVAFVEMLMHFC
jgi:hypothetical protein